MKIWPGRILAVLVHAGIHFNAILGWLAVWAMLINVASGLTGKYLLRRVHVSRLDAAREQSMRGAGPVGRAQLDERTLLGQPDRRYRQAVGGPCTRPITLAFGVLALAHIISIEFLFWGWK